jgi:hypothetical protein
MQPNTGQYSQQGTYESVVAPRASYVSTPPWISMFFWLGITVMVVSLVRMILGLIFLSDFYYMTGGFMSYVELIFDTFFMGLFYGFVLLGIGFHLKNQWKLTL